MADPDTPTIKVALLGSAGVGKESFAKRFIDGAKGAHRLTCSNGSATSYPITFLTNCGPVIVDLIVADSGENGFMGSSNSAPSPFSEIKVQGGIMMFSVTDAATYEQIPKIFDTFRLEQEQSPEDIAKKNAAPICLIGNKVDLGSQRAVRAKDITFHRRENLQYYDVAALSNYNIEKPFLWILRKYFKNDELLFVDAPPMEAPQEFF